MRCLGTKAVVTNDPPSPTHDAGVVETAETIRDIRGGIVVLVEGDKAGDAQRQENRRGTLIDYHDSDSFSTTSFLDNTREQSSHRFLSGSIVSL